MFIVFSLAPAMSEAYSFIRDYDAIDLAAKSVFYVEVYDSIDRCIGSASGFIAFDEHLFVTNDHVNETNRKCAVVNKNWTNQYQ